MPGQRLPSQCERGSKPTHGGLLTAVVDGFFCTFSRRLRFRLFSFFLDSASLLTLHPLERHS